MFELYKHSGGRRKHVPKITIRKGGMITLNKLLVREYGLPVNSKMNRMWCQLFFDAKERKIGIKLNVEKEAPGAVEICYGEIRSHGFLRYFGIDITKIKHFLAEKENDMLILCLNNPID